MVVSLVITAGIIGSAIIIFLIYAIIDAIRKGIQSVNRKTEKWKEKIFSSEKHRCKYCGVMTTQDDELCYANPNYQEKEL